MKRILMLSLVLALLAAMVISTAAFAQGPNGGSDGSQARQGATARMAPPTVRAMARVPSVAGSSAPGRRERADVNNRGSATARSPNAMLSGPHSGWTT